MAYGFAMLFVGLALGVAYGGIECIRLDRPCDAVKRAFLCAALISAAGASLVYLPAAAPDPFRQQHPFGFDGDWSCAGPKGDFCVKRMRY